MSHHESSRSQTRRPPLADATLRVNNTQSKSEITTKDGVVNPQNEGLRVDDHLRVHNDSSGSHESRYQATAAGHMRDAAAARATAANNRLSAISKEYQDEESKRNSQISTVSTNASGSGRRKTHIGPWQLGKTLGKGATARVRLARHATTGQMAAIKIVQKKNAQLSQAGSLASLDMKDAQLPNVSEGCRRMPYGIEREVAIMKLIEHPHIMRLYDIWENRTEIYLILEYVDDGELFEHISYNGRLEEEEAMRFFRQILSAIGYCHALNICHRDLKPENILVNKNGNIKIADFGMAALQQSPQHRLQTSCGSPHYAAPEVIRSGPYRGSKVDVWSMGIILFAEVCGFLPFDNDHLPTLLGLIRRGRFYMPEELNPQLQDLLWRMLKVDPHDRISIQQIWRHPQLRKYDYLDDFGDGANMNLPNPIECGRPVTRRSDIDRDLLRHLRSMWHTLEDSQIIKLLLNDQPNDQKMFYALLIKHRENQLENYVPDINYSNSDYHHGKRPSSRIKKLSTRQFTQAKADGHGTQVSRFTVVGNVNNSQHSRKGSRYEPTEGGGTSHSYDPYNSSRTQYWTEPDSLAHAKVVVHKGKANLQGGAASRSGVPMSPESGMHASSASVKSTSTGKRKDNKLVAPRRFVSRSSLASSTRSRGSASHIRVARAHRHGISFRHSRTSVSSPGQSIDERLSNSIVDRHSKYSEVTDDGGDDLRAIGSPSTSSRYVRSRKGSANPGENVTGSKDRTSQVWHDDVRQLSTNLAKDCDEAFNRSSVGSTLPTPTSTRYSDYDNTPASSIHADGFARVSSSLIPAHLEPHIAMVSKARRHSDRPLPTAPSRSESTKLELIEARRHAAERKLSGEDDLTPRHYTRMVSHIDKLLESPSASRADNRRIVSAPVKSYETKYENRQLLQAINEASSEDASPRRRSGYDDLLAEQRRKAANRNTSAPGDYYSRLDLRTAHLHPKRDSGTKESIRVIHPSTPSPPKAPAPLNIRKRVSVGVDTFAPGDLPNASETYSWEISNDRGSDTDQRQRRSNGSRQGERDDSSQYDVLSGQSSAGTVQKKVSSWFQRGSSKSYVDQAEANARHSSGGDTNMPKRLMAPESPKKKAFGGLTRFFKRSNRNEDPTTAFKIYDGDDASLTSVEDQRRSYFDQHENGKIRQIEPHQNWLARLFKVKPANKYLCFGVSKHRARRELASVLRDWRKYGVKDIVIDKERNMVFARVGANNCELLYIDEGGHQANTGPDLHLKEVSFACEILTIIEHGKKFPLSIVRFTQEKGANSSFNKVVDTMETVLRSRGMLVSDNRRRRMMIRTLEMS